MLPRNLEKNLLGEEIVMESSGVEASFISESTEKTEKPWEMAMLVGVAAFIYILQFDFKISALLILSYLIIFFGFGKNVIASFPLRGIFSRTLGESGKVVANLIFMTFISLLAFNLGIETICILIIFLTFVFYKWSKHFGTVLGIIFLLSVPFLLVFDVKELAGRMANYSYYFFAISVVFQISEYFIEKRESEEVLVFCPKGDSVSGDKNLKNEDSSFEIIADFVKNIFVGFKGRSTYILVLITVFATLLFYSNILIASGVAFFLAFLWFYWSIDIPRFLAVAFFIAYMLTSTFNPQLGQMIAYVAAYFLAVWLFLEFDRGFFRKVEC